MTHSANEYIQKRDHSEREEALLRVNYKAFSKNFHSAEKDSGLD